MVDTDSLRRLSMWMRGKNIDMDVPFECDNPEDAADEIEARRDMGDESMMSGKVLLDLIDDEEAACMLAYDRGETCSGKGRECFEDDD